MTHSWDFWAGFANGTLLGACVAALAIGLAVRRANRS